MTDIKTHNQLLFYIISAFCGEDQEALGNPTAVVFMEAEAEDFWYKRVASDLNQPATTFLIPRNEPGHFNVRWFAPDAEIELCGHGSFGAGGAVYLSKGLQKIVLHPKVGLPLTITTLNNNSSLEISAINSQEAPTPENLEEALGVPIESFHTSSNKQIVVLKSEKLVHTMKPNFSKLADQKYFGFIVTAKGNDCDFVSRTLVPKVQQLEDFATGSSHAVLVPFWQPQIGKDVLIAKQLSRRGGLFKCTHKNKSVMLSGNYRKVCQGTIAKP